jgi:hypothetical protein
MKKQAFLLGAVLTVIAGGLAVFFIMPALWAPGIFVASVVIGESYDWYLGTVLSWSIVVAVNFLVYSAIAWLLIVIVEKLREENRQAHS